MDVREKLVELLNGVLTTEDVTSSEEVACHLIAHGVTVIPPEGIGEMSDGYHTFNELYHHRAVLFSVICNAMPDKAWKSKRHDTGDMYDGMFIVGIETNHGQATYHYDVDPYWDMFNVPELEYAPKWDGHTPQEAINRIANGVTVQDNTEISEELLKQLRNAPITILQEEPTVEVVQEWISVKDRLPEESGMYIVTANDGRAQRVSFVQWQKKNRMWNLTGARSYWRVTHWMPLPEPPKGE